MFKLFSSIAIALLLVSIASCTHKTDLSGLKEVSFSNDIQPILSGNCTQSNCHAGNGRLFSLTTYDDVINEGHVKAGDPHGSELYQTISNNLLATTMPSFPQPSLTTDQIKLIYTWILQGAKNN